MICKAPFNNMYFTVLGQVSPCWKLPGYCDQWSHKRSIKDIWKGEQFQKYRYALSHNVFINKCSDCQRDIEAGVWPLAKAYAEFPIQPYPSLMELELSNQCNLECTMCSGMLSSGIRKNREGLPPLPQIYDEKFIEELKEFIPHLKELRFNGGEPFAQKIVLDICDVVAELNPSLKINFATNGTVYNKRVEHILDKCNIHLNISIDSLIPERYEAIRINGKFDVLMENFAKFRRYCHDNDRWICVMVNPMNNNWDEMVEFVEWCDVQNVFLHYNTILYPRHLTIKDLPKDEILKIHSQLTKEFDDLPKHIVNYDKIENLLKHIRSWAK